MTMDNADILATMKSTKDQYGFLNALFDDYSLCKTELARNGIMKAIKVLLERINDEHIKLIEKTISLDKELAETKAKLPKTKEEIAKILHDAGFHELEEVEGGTWHHGLPSPELTPKEYAELYRRLYGEMTKSDEKKLDREIKKLDEQKAEEEIAQIKASEKVLEDKNLENNEDKELDPAKQMTPEEFFDSDKSSVNDKKIENNKKSKSKSSQSKSKNKKVVKKNQK